MPSLGWTEADQAELNVGIWALVCAIDEHKPGCVICEIGFPPCPVVGTMIEALIDWFVLRRMLSKAEYLRRRHLLDRLGELEEARA